MNCTDLTFAEARFIQLRDTLQIVAHSIWFSKPAFQRLRAVEREYLARTIFKICVIGKTHQFASGFVGEPNLVLPLYPFELAICIAAGLALNAGQNLSFFIFFGLSNTHRHSINEQCVIHRSSTGRKFAHCHPKRSSQVQCFHILNDPAAFLQLFVNLFPCFCFRSHDAAPALL